MPLAETQYPLDENGIPIKPGYRKPFNSESGRIAAFKAASARAKNDAQIARAVLRQVHELLSNHAANSRDCKSLSKPRSATNHVVVTRDSKSVQTTTPISPTISPRPVKKNASAVKPEGINPAVSPVVSPKPTIAPPGQPTSQAAQEPDDDCLF